MSAFVILPPRLSRRIGSPGVGLMLPPSNPASPKTLGEHLRKQRIDLHLSATQLIDLHGLGVIEGESCSSSGSTPQSPARQAGLEDLPVGILPLPAPRLNRAESPKSQAPGKKLPTEIVHLLACTLAHRGRRSRAKKSQGSECHSLPFFYDPIPGKTSPAALLEFHPQT